jgi:hypothetical protein
MKWLRKSYRGEPEYFLMAVGLVIILSLVTALVIALISGNYQDDSSTTIQCVHIGNNPCFPIVIPKEKG